MTGVSCPDCGGVLNVQTEGRDATLVFECRIGHTFDVPELLTAKEERLEEYLWAANRMLEELAALLLDLAAHGAEHGESDETIHAFRVRAARARAGAVVLRAVIKDSRPVDLAPAAADVGSVPPEGFGPAGGPGTA